MLGRVAGTVPASPAHREPTAFAQTDRYDGCVDAALRAWLKDLSRVSAGDASRASRPRLSDEGADYLERIVTDGTLRSAFNELAEADPELIG